MLSRVIFHRNRLRNSLLSTRVKAWRIHHGDPSAGGEGKHSGGRGFTAKLVSPSFQVGFTVFSSTSLGFAVLLILPTQHIFVAACGIFSFADAA